MGKIKRRFEKIIEVKCGTGDNQTHVSDAAEGCEEIYKDRMGMFFKELLTLSINGGISSWQIKDMAEQEDIKLHKRVRRY